jgi:hypothetical protein
MVVQDFYLEKYDWYVRVYYSADITYSNDIIEDIISIGCCKDELTDVISFIKRMSYNSGFTYSSPDYKSSVLVISKTTCGAEFQDTFDHEKGHLAMHITESFDIDPFSEEYQYLVGSIGKKMYPVAKFYLCDNCREDE